MTMPEAARRLIVERRLASHPEGGWYREILRTRATVATPHGDRARETAIEFLLADGQVSLLHRLRQEEIWTHLEGPGLDLHLLPPGSDPVLRRLAPGSPPVAVPAGVWMGAEAPGRWALVSCVCRPGFDFADLEFGARDGLVAAWPQHAAAIRRLTP